MLSQRYPIDELNIASKEDFRPFATIEDRDFWVGLPESVKRLTVQAGEKALAFTWPSLPATVFLEVARIGNRYNYERINFERRNRIVELVQAECVENEGRFVDQLVNGIWVVCEESYWGLPAHLTMQKAGRGLPDTAEPTVDLFAAETAAMLAWVLYLVGPRLDEVNALIRPRIEREITQRILIPNLERDDFGWMALNWDGTGRRPNNWNPWINSNWLTCVLLIEPDPALRKAHIEKIMRSVDKFIDPYPQDGGCDEGPGYWARAAASMYDCLELLYFATDGQVDVYDQPLVQAMGQFLYRTQIADDYYVNFADASAIVLPDGALIYDYGKRIKDPDMMAAGAWIAGRQRIYDPEPLPENSDKQSLGPTLGRQLPSLAVLNELATAEAYAPLPRDVFLPDIEVIVARDKARSKEGFFVTAKGGNNDESHNHNDIGQYVVFIDGLPVLIDAGVETYSVKTFSEQRYDIWTMQSGYHNLPTINGVMQKEGPQYMARDVQYSADDAQASFSLDIAGAYPDSLGLERWQRTVRLERGSAVVVEDNYTLDATPQSITYNLLTPCAVDLSTAGAVTLSTRPLVDGRESGSGTIHYDATQFSAAVETVPITDMRMRPVWGDTLFRVVLTARNPGAQGQWALRVTR